MALPSEKVGISLIGPPGSGKTTLSKIVIPYLGGWTLHDHDNDGMEDPIYGLGKGGVANKLKEIGDRAFLAWESTFTIDHYGRSGENKTFPLNNMLFASSGSLVRSRDAMNHIRERTHVVLLDIPMAVVLEQIASRPDGAGRIIGMNGGPDEEKPMSASLKDELLFRDTLYKSSHDSRLEHIPGETPEATGSRLATLIQSILS